MNIFSNTANLFATNQVSNLANLKCALLNATYVFNSANSTLANILPTNEVSGNGWPVGGNTIQGAAITLVNTDDAMLDGNDISITASGGQIGAANSLIIYDSSGAANTNWKPLFHYYFGSSKTADVGTPFNITFAANGIARWVTP